MVFNTKCLWTLTVTLFICVLSSNLCHCETGYDVLKDNSDIYDGLRDETDSETSQNDINGDERAKIATGEKRGWNSNFAVWGKRLYDSNPNEGEADLSIAQIHPDKRKWSKFASWGKRQLPIVYDFDPEGQGPNDKREVEILAEPLNIDEPEFPNDSGAPQRIGNDMNKRKWQALNTWGKRRYNMEGPAKSSWSSFTTWGKRDSESDLDDVDKRKWQFASWGKRNAEPYLYGIDKRKWAKFATWGKREYESLLDDLDKRGKWSKFTSWGKRSETDGDLEAAKRKWAKFNSWGKRDNGVETDELGNVPDERNTQQIAVFDKWDDETNPTVDKRKWSKFASWGKRPRNRQAWLALNAWGKRRWTGLTTWGKRSGSDFKIETVARTLLRFFDMNGDGALDFDELHNYIRTLMSLPSKHEAEENLPEVEE